MFSKALVVGEYQRKLEEIARHADVELVAIAPPSWRDHSREVRLERLHLEGYKLVVSPLALNGNFHLFFLPQLGHFLDQHRPDILHFDEEPYNLATLLAVAQARQRGVPALFFTWQNLVRRYPPPFTWMESFVYRTAAWAIAGTEAAERVLRGKGYKGRCSVIPQFGVDPERFMPGPAHKADRPFTIGFAGRLVPEKGVALLVEACARLTFDFRLVVRGSGPAEKDIRRVIFQSGLEARTFIEPAGPSSDMPHWLQGLDVLVLPSVSRPNWTEQFGRIMIEAMACGVPVVGSTCGEIPTVIGEAGIVFPEGDDRALAEALEGLARDHALRARLAEHGRKRVLDRFTHEQIAAATVEVYRSMRG